MIPKPPDVAQHTALAIILPLVWVSDSSCVSVSTPLVLFASLLVLDLPNAGPLLYQGGNDKTERTVRTRAKCPLLHKHSLPLDTRGLINVLQKLWGLPRPNRIFIYFSEKPVCLGQKTVNT